MQGFGAKGKALYRNLERAGVEERYQDKDKAQDDS